MARGPKRPFLTRGRGDRDIGIGIRRIADQARLADIPPRRQQIGMARTKRAAGPLAMDVERVLLAFHPMGFQLAGVVGHVVQYVQPAFRKEPGEGSPGQMGEHLAIGERDKLRLHELIKGFEQRGFYLDNQSQQVLVSFYERMGNVERMSDSGDAVYVRKTI